MSLTDAAVRGVNPTVKPQKLFDGKGVVIFTLAGGGSIRDTGRELFYSARDEKAHGVALAYAALKWGKNVALENGRILFHQAPEIQREQEKGWSR
jgi:hypothetical protein